MKAITIGITTVFILSLLMAMTACSTQQLAPKLVDIKADANIGKTYSVSGKVVSVVKTRLVTGYKMIDGNETIDVKTDVLPAVNSTVTATGKLQYNEIFGYYLLVETNK